MSFLKVLTTTERKKSPKDDVGVLTWGYRDTICNLDWDNDDKLKNCGSPGLKSNTWLKPKVCVLMKKHVRKFLTLSRFAWKFGTTNAFMDIQSCFTIEPWKIPPGPIPFYWLSDRWYIVGVPNMGYVIRLPIRPPVISKRLYSHLYPELNPWWLMIKFDGQIHYLIILLNLMVKIYICWH